MSAELWTLLLPAVAGLALMSGFPVAFALGGSALLVALAAHAGEHFDLRLLAGLPSRYFGIMSNEVLVAVPLFVVMGVALEKSGIAEQLLDAMARALGGLRGGLALSVVVVGALVAASTGIVGATVVTMGLIGLPSMMRAGYDVRVATGTICAAGTLGQIIPPSIALVILADMLQGAHQEAQLALGNFSPDPVSVVDLFAGALLPGLVLVFAYLIYLSILARRSPDRLPPAPAARPAAGHILHALVALILAVLGSILGGIATPTEAAGLGAGGALALALLRGRLDVASLDLIMQRSVRITAMIFLVLLGASIFALVFRGLGGDQLVRDLLTDAPGGRAGALALVMATMFLLGFFLEFVEIVFVVVPIVGPVLLATGIDPIWLGVLMAINLQTSFLTPPFGFALFYLRGVAPPEVTTTAIYRGIVPFVLIQLAVLLLVALVPQLATWLPGVLFP